MNEYRMEKLDADMREDMAEEYFQERCPHDTEHLYVNDIRVTIDAQQKISDDMFIKYLKKDGTCMFTIKVDMVCSHCGASQEQDVDIEQFIECQWPLEWEE